MDTVSRLISISSLIGQHGSSATPLLVDVRRTPVFADATHLIAGAIWRDPFQLDSWTHLMPRHRDVVVYCVHGHEISKNTADALVAQGIRAGYLDGGYTAWVAANGPITQKSQRPMIPSAVSSPSRWVTRERPKIDRIACPWLIRRFIDPLAEFVYVAADQVLAYATAHDAIPYDIPGVQFTHRGDKCSFDAIVADFDLNDPPLNSLATIVRGADCGVPQLTPESAGLLAASLGLSALHRDDHDMLEKGMDLYDALYAWAKHARTEAHNAALFNRSSPA